MWKLDDALKQFTWVLLRRVVRVQNQMLAQWACTMIPIYVVRRRHADGDIVVDEAMVVAVVGR